MITDQTLFSNTKPMYPWRFNKENISAVKFVAKWWGNCAGVRQQKKGVYCTSQLTNRTSQLCHCHPALPFALKSIIHANEFINKKSSMKTREKGCKQISITVRNLFIFLFFCFQQELCVTAPNTVPNRSRPPPNFIGCRRCTFLEGGSVQQMSNLWSK